MLFLIDDQNCVKLLKKNLYNMKSYTKRFYFICKNIIKTTLKVSKGFEERFP